MEAYLLHDANAGSNLKLMIMIQEEGMKGYGIYWTVLEFLRLQNEYKASLKVIPILAQKARVPENNYNTTSYVNIIHQSNYKINIKKSLQI